MKESIIKYARMSMRRLGAGSSRRVERFPQGREGRSNTTVVVFEKTGRGVACDEDFNAEHEVYGHVIRHHRRSATRRIVKSRNEEGIVYGSPRKNNVQISF